MAQNKGDIKIRRMVENDLPRVNEIDRSLFSKGRVTTWPFSFENYWEVYHPKLRFVAELKGEVVGFLVGVIGKEERSRSMFSHTFRATLEELSEANILLHVVDLTSHNAPEQCQTVEDILADLNLMDKPRITALNKIDLLLDSGQTWDEKSAINYLSDRDDVNKDTVLIPSLT
ncbi:unnamed protein product [marine sediment metagenome]|uniref:Hflx-type G domain-containing protein n=1 Tax=marine sediment metagenome TaxID=412755 RepID=X1SIX8_9ZZZZ